MKQYQHPEGFQGRRRLAQNPQGYAWVRLVMEPGLHDALVRAADREKVTLSEFVRRACRAYVKKP